MSIRPTETYTLDHSSQLEPGKLAIATKHITITPPANAPDGTAYDILAHEPGSVSVAPNAADGTPVIHSPACVLRLDPKQAPEGVGAFGTLLKKDGAWFFAGNLAPASGDLHR